MTNSILTAFIIHVQHDQNRQVPVILPATKPSASSFQFFDSLQQLFGKQNGSLGKLYLKHTYLLGVIYCVEYISQTVCVHYATIVRPVLVTSSQFAIS